MLNMGVAYQISAQVAGGNQVGGLRKEVTALKNETALLPKSFKTATASAKEFAAVLGIGFGAEKLVEFGKGALESAARVKDLASRTGLSTDAIQKLGYAAKLTGADIDAVASAAVKMNVKIGNALSGNNTAIQAFQQLQLDPKKLSGMDSDERFYAIAEAIGRVNDAALKAKLGADVFGKGFAAILPIMSQGEDSARNLGNELQRIGGVISAEDIERLDMLDDTITRIGLTAKSKAAQGLAFLVQNSDELIDAATVLSVVFGTKLAVALAISTREYVLNTLAVRANAEAQLLAQLQAQGNVRAILAMGTASARLTSGLNSLVAFMGGPLNVALMAAGAAWYYTGTQLDENITRAAALRAVLITLRGEYEKGAYLKSTEPFFGIGGKSQSERSAGVKAIQDGIDTELSNLRTPDSETATGKAKADMARSIKESKEQAAQTLAEIEKAQAAADARSKSKSDAASAGERATKEKEKELRQLDDFILKQRQANDELAHQNEFIGMTTIEISKLEAARKLDDEAAKATIRMQPDVKARYLETTDAIKQQRLELMQKNYDEKRTFSSGTKEAITEYLETIGDAASSAKQFWSNSFNSMEDALVSFTKTGKLNFKDMASSIIDDIIRIQVRSTISGPLASLLGSLNPFGGGSAASKGAVIYNSPVGPFQPGAANAFADGGVMTSNGPVPLRKYATGGVASSPQMALFGEGSHNEAFVPLPDGKRIPVAMSGGGGISITIVNQIGSDGTSSTSATATGGSDAEKANALARQMASVAKGVILKEKMPGGILA